MSPKRIACMILPLSLGMFTSQAFCQQSSGNDQPAAALQQSGALQAHIKQNGQNYSCILENDKLRFEISVAERTITSANFTDKLNARSFSLGPDVFKLGFGQDDDKSKMRHISAKEFLAQQPQLTQIKADAKALRLADRKHAAEIRIPFAWSDEGLALEWWAELREDSSYVRVGLDLVAQQGALAVKEIILLDFAAPEARVEGKVDGVPVSIDQRMFCGIESPLGHNFVKDGRVISQMKRKMPLPSRSKVEVSAVLGVSRHGQLRRTFQLDYINNERARPYSTFLNYNTWYDIGYFKPYSEADALRVVNTYGEELVRKRGVKIDSFMFDDGWDDPKTLWKFHKDLPQELKKVRKQAESYGAQPGIWFSPWGGYGEPKNQRLKAAEGSGFETDAAGFALAGPKYYEHFRKECLRMVRENGVNHFKFDGTGNAETSVKGSKFGTNFKAVISLIKDLRKERSDMYINLTTGTWASPFWFGIADSIYRGGWDHEFIGEGTQRNRWMTFRDARTYQNNVAKSPLFPINSLMTHGVIFAKQARGLDSDPGNDLGKEIWSSFGSGTQMQEVYVSPELLDQQQWDELAKGAKWARDNEKTLIDVHWVGGDPAHLKVYGWAAWSPQKSVLTMRNPAGRKQSFSFDAASVWEIPQGHATSFTLSSPNGSKLPQTQIESGKTLTIELEPFEVVVIEATPLDAQAK